ncbi:MAG: hypothetical protein IPJ41_10390 [Phycisphaerales bacterium]|nr:hypothetical protein [Phycisphaerales bacterium]
MAPALLLRLVLMPAEITDGRSAWSQFIGSVERTFTENAGTIPIIGLLIVLVVVVVVDWKFAGWIERLWRRKHDHDVPHEATQHAVSHAQPHAQPHDRAPGRAGTHPHH